VTINRDRITLDARAQLRRQSIQHLQTAAGTTGRQRLLHQARALYTWHLARNRGRERVLLPAPLARWIATAEVFNW
jgi:hypothetical protein